MEQMDAPGIHHSSNEHLQNLVQESPSDSISIEIPQVSLPKGGGALRGIDEKFEVNAFNGAASFSIPIPLSSGRNGFSPNLALAYNSGNGNSPFGIGWSIDIPSIQRKTDRGLPRYREDSEDTFLFSGVEDLVPFLEEGNDWKLQNLETNGFTIRRYRPRIEGSFAKIEKIQHELLGEYWRVTDRENVVTIYGRAESARISDPENPSRTFKWLPEFSYDDRGNWVTYEYKQEDLANVPPVLYESRRRNGLSLFSNVYLKKIKYGNHRPYFPPAADAFNPPLPTDTTHFFEVILDYGEHRANDLLTEGEPPSYAPQRQWSYRPDAFSSYRSGFEIRTYRRCLGILLFHHFPEEAEFGSEYLVRSMNLIYDASNINQSGNTEVSYLRSITQSGYIRKPGGTYAKKSLPPMEFDYQRLNWSEEIKSVSPDNIINAPAGLTNNYQWVDLYGEGISGILTEEAAAWYYKSNLGDVEEEGSPTFTHGQKVAPKPTFLGMTNATLSLQDLVSDGQKQIVVNDGSLQGYFELGKNKDWEGFQPFEAVANIRLDDRNTRLLDLNGDGKPDLVITEENVFVWYANNGKKGHKPAEHSFKPFDEEQGPAILFADLEQSIFLADMTGDGLTDIVRVRNGEICYWANQGYGKFSAKVPMSQAPLFDHPEAFNPKYLHLSDISGTGTTDLLYLGKNQFKAFLNLSGNAWSDAHEIDPFFPIDEHTQISVIDLLGTGTSCIVWSSDLPGHSQSPMRFIDLMGGKKPHVLHQYKNNLGKETTLEYKSSTWFYLKDKQTGAPWITKLPFPVQVVHKTTIEEKITNVRFCSEYSYHHGYYDHPEREFRGFGRVDQLDSEFYGNWKANIATSQLEQSEELYQAPMLTKTWYHTGAFLDRERILSQFAQEYWFEEYNRLFPDAPLSINEPQLADANLQAAPDIADTAIVSQLSAEEWREALRACKGMMLRQEVFSLDAGDEAASMEERQRQAKPYIVTSQNCQLQLIQPRSENPFGVFMRTEQEVIKLHYERNEADPRIAHTINVALDELGNILEEASIVYPRRQADLSLPLETRQEQQKTYITYTQRNYTNDVRSVSAHRLRKISQRNAPLKLAV